jgi:undecaprenyl-diphosphatase
MDSLWKSIILGIIEGITEFLPISSTGHLILANEFIKLDKEFAAVFDVVIQLGAILSVIVYFWDRLFPFSPKRPGSSVVTSGSCGLRRLQEFFRRF